MSRSSRRRRRPKRPPPAPAPRRAPAPVPAVEAAPAFAAELDLGHGSASQEASLDVGSELDFGAPNAPSVPDLMVAPRRPAEAKYDDGPELAPRVAAPAASAPSAPSRKAPPAASFDDGMDMGDGATIDLGSTTSPADAAPAAAPPPKVLPTILESEDGGLAAATKLGDYGEVPAEAWKAPIYAYRVKMRQLELRKLLAEKRAGLDQAQSVVDDALVGIAARARASVEGADSYGKLLGDVIVAETALRERDSALAAEMEAHKQKTSGLDARITQHEAELQGARAEQRSYTMAFERVDAIRQRADAKLKRVDIDLRAATARAGGAAAQDADVAARTSEREARALELAQSLPDVTEARQKLTVAERKASAIEQSILVAKNERAALEEQFRKKGATHGAQVAKAQKEVRIALAALGRMIVSDTSRFPGAEWASPRAEITALDRAVAARNDEVLLHVMALDVHHRETVQKGMGLALGALVLLLLIFLIPVAVSAFSAPPQPHRPPAPAVDPNE